MMNLGTALLLIEQTTKVCVFVDGVQLVEAVPLYRLPVMDVIGMLGLPVVNLTSSEHALVINLRKAVR